MKVKYKKYSVNLKDELIESKNIDTDTLTPLYVRLFKVFEKASNTNYLKILYKCVLEIEEIEFEMQDAWGFKRNRDMHRWWFDNDICTCPKAINFSSRKAGIRHINPTCKLHGEPMDTFIDRMNKLNKLAEYDEQDN